MIIMKLIEWQESDMRRYWIRDGSLVFFGIVDRKVITFGGR